MLGEKYINVGGQLICQREIELWRLQQQQQIATGIVFINVKTFRKHLKHF